MLECKEYLVPNMNLDLSVQIKRKESCNNLKTRIFYVLTLAMNEYILSIVVQSHDNVSLHILFVTS